MNWIKVETCTPNKPELLAIARICGVTRAEAFLGWFTLWSTLDALVGKHGSLDGYSREDVDRISGIIGMGNALADVGWIQWTDTGCVINNWDRHNGESAKARALSARRMAALRSRRNGSVTLGPSPEKRR